MQTIIDFFNHPFFIIVGGLTTLSVIVAFISSIYLIIKGVLPVWYRLGIGLSKRKIAVFADSEFESLKNMLVDSGIFLEKNIVRIDAKSLKKAESLSLLLVHWKCFESEFENIVNIKKDSDALIIFAPQEEGFIDNNSLQIINTERNSIVVNFRGRLLNDILISMITTSYEKR
ncbi:MAG: hypothetical protein WAR79_20725 [Melioribacteraceae bacterium]